jgi:hypothetical protein
MVALRETVNILSLHTDECQREREATRKSMEYLRGEYEEALRLLAGERDGPKLMRENTG